MSAQFRGVFQGASFVLHHTLENVLTELGTSALVWNEGGTLFVHARAAVDVATLPQAAELCHKYLKLKNGEIAVTNDPYSGGTVLSDFTLVMGVRLEGTGSEADVLLAKRISLAPSLSPGLKKPSKLDDEGVRVPPTPLAGAGVLNRDLLQAIATHPRAPRGLFDRVVHAVDDLKTAAARLQAIARDPGTILRKSNLKTYLEDSTRAFEMLMTRLPLGTVTVTSQFPSGEALKLQLKITEEHLSFDFGGSESSATLALTELATFGACFAATASIFDDHVPLNSGTFQFFQVSAPAKTILSAAPPTGTYRGMTEGAAAVCALARQAIAKLTPQGKPMPVSGQAPSAQLLFEDGRSLSLSVPAGAAATATGPGASAVNAWDERRPFVEKLDELERDFPLLLVSIGARAGSGGNGKHRGGDGSVFGVEVLSPCELRWIEPALGHRFEGKDGGRSGQPSAIEIVRASPGKTESVSAREGASGLAAGDRVFVMSAGGGGFGEAHEPDDDKSGADERDDKSASKSGNKSTRKSAKNSSASSAD